MGNKKNIFVRKVFFGLKKIYLILPVDNDFKVKAKGIFYKVFGRFFQNTPSYQQWVAINEKAKKRGKVKIDKNKLKNFHFSKKIAIQLHLFYDDLMDEFVSYFKHMPYKFDLYISIIDESKKQIIMDKAKTIPHVQNVIIKKVENRGRDVSPLVSVFGNDILKYDYFCHVHSKKSLFTGNEQMDWRKHLLDHLFGSELLIKSIFYWFENGEKVGMVYPETFAGMPYWGHTWLQNEGSRDELFGRIGMIYPFTEKYIEYPMGTMFWARTDALRQFFEAGIKVSDFPKESGQTDGTIAHAFERCLVPVCRLNGYNILIFDNETGEFNYNKGKKNFYQYCLKNFEQMKLDCAAHDVISFDIFDTLVSRVVAAPDDTFDLLEIQLKSEGMNIPYKKIRKQAEQLCREKNPDLDCDLDDIYQEFKGISGLSPEICEKIKNAEVENELNLIVPRSEMVDLFNYVVRELKKKVILITDMYLRRCDIEKILQKCGIIGYTELWLSSETNLRKDNGSAWKAYAEKYNPEKCLHIGDNEKADIQLSGDYKIHNYHILSSRDLFECSDAGEFYKIIGHEINPINSIYCGLVLNRLFHNPFVMNENQMKIKITTEYDLGYAIAGPAVLGYMHHLATDLLKHDTRQVFFFAREGYLLKDLFDIMKDIVKEISYINGEYLLVSRRALTVASLQNHEDISELLDIYYRGSFSNLLLSRFGIVEEDASDEQIGLPEQKDKVLKMLGPYMEQILKRAESERKNYLKYYQSLQGSVNSKIAISDIGYSGTIQYYLSKLTGHVYDGYYFATDNKKKPLKIDGNTIEGFYIDNDSRQEYSDSYIHRYHLILESILIAPTGQLLYVDDNGEFQYTEKKNSQYTAQIEKIQEGIKAYVADFYTYCGKNAFGHELDKSFAEELMHIIMECDIIDKKLKKYLVVEDSYCMDSKISAIEHYKKIEENS